MKFLKVFLFIGSMMILSTKVIAQTTIVDSTMSLEQIWQVAENNNHSLQLSDLKIQESNLAILESKDQQLPELLVSGDVKLNSKFLIYDNGLFSKPENVPIKGYGYGAGYNFNFNLYNGGKIRRGIEIKKEEVSHKKYELELQKHSVKYNTAVAYYALYKLLHFRDFLDSEIVSEKKQLSQIKSLFKNGVVLKSDTLRTTVKLSQLELNLSDIEKKIGLSKQRLNILMGKDMDDNFTISYQNDTSNMDISKDSGYKEFVKVALNSSPEFKIVNSDLKLSELNILQIKSALLPKISFYSYYNYTYPQISFYPYSNNLWGFGQTGIKVQYSIDNLLKNKHSIAHAQVINSQIKENGRIKKDEITLQIKEAYLDQQQAIESVLTAEKNIVKTTETVRVIRNSYLNQESLLTDLLQAENTLLEAKFNLTSEHTNLKLSHIRLLAIMGIL